MRSGNRRHLALALVLGVVLLGGSDGAGTWASSVGNPHGLSGGGYVGALPYGGLAALAEAAPSLPAPSPVPMLREGHDHNREQGLLNIMGDFIRGYRDLGGNPAWETRFTQQVIPCESGWEWQRGDSFHVSVAQFSPASWATASKATGLADPESLYHVGANVAWWSSEVGPEPPGGWSCW